MSTSQELQRADAQVTDAERQRSAFLQGMQRAAAEAEAATLRQTGDKQLAAFQAMRTKMDFADAVQRSPELSARATRELEDLAPALRNRALPPPPDRNEKLRQVDTPTIVDAAGAATALAVASGRESDREVALSLQAEVAARRAEMLRGERPASEFQATAPDKAERAQRISVALDAVKPAGRTESER